jgi:hypothetical protein
MKKLIALAIIMAVMVLVAALVHAQTPAIDLKPTFISPTPGLYVNGWPAFTVSYPKEWVEWPTLPGATFSAGGRRPDLPADYFLPSLNISYFPLPLPLEDWAKFTMANWANYADVKVLSDRPSRLKDGTPAREVELEFVVKNGSTAKVFLLVTKKKDDYFYWIRVKSDKGLAGEDLKRIAYSLAFQPDREKPVQVPPDVKAFLDMHCADVVSHDVKAIMEHFSDRFLSSGMSKAYLEQGYRNDPGSPIQKGVISQEATVTVFEPRGDKAYLDGFFLAKFKGDADALKHAMLYQQIIKEHGEWRWFGNQK